MSRASTAPSSPEIHPVFERLSMAPRSGSGATTPEQTAALPPSPLPSGKHRVCVIGSGSWGTALAKIAAENVARRKADFEPQVNMWVREKLVGGKSLIDTINTTHRNQRYLPDVDLPENLVAVPKLKDVVAGSDLIVLVTPHQFLHTVLAELKRSKAIAPGARCVSAIKGVEVNGTEIETFASLIERELGTPCSALSGANIALEVALGQFCETTIGCPSAVDAALWEAVFDNADFRVNCVEDVNGVSLGGALKNVVALAAGMVDGLRLGGNTKAAILRIGLGEMTRFTQEFFPGVQHTTFSNESAGIADLITTCYGGRNRKCAEEFVKSGDSFEKIERRLLNGQKLQGTATAEEVNRFLEARGRTEAYPLFEKVYRIAFEGLPPQELVKGL
ncbi:glycerol-3-phosphate dehydrogenase (NAD+) [Trichosporon asahii var. asahii CBS 8904]|uniref:Glycerol-3-phosphate dehydrogenase [NAD(+)] n=1 Tax=Trichosporon asahii var. asahii (strain CBS 8904) TaxID=1220162 RepID=K1WQY8_TRIAC|nr:glycerol-3-phosphate dehydrogenase (NAD+) [Trichosporon asahii var. asahii CBS 8904]